jgi:hypothetical protein
VDAEQDIAAPWKNSQALCAIAPSIETESLAPVSTLQQDNVPPPRQGWYDSQQSSVNT